MTGGVCLQLTARLHGVQASSRPHPPSTASALADGGSRGARGRLLSNNRACTTAACTQPLRRGAPRERERVLWQHACASAEGPRTTSGAVQSNRTNGASAAPLGPVWVYPRYGRTKYMSSVDAPCVHECGGPTHDERRRASKSHEWCLSDAAGARVGACALPTEVGARATERRCAKLQGRRACAARRGATLVARGRTTT